MKRICDCFARIVPPIERWPTRLVSLMGLLAWLLHEHQKLMLGAVLVLLVPATLAIGINTEAVVLWGLVGLAWANIANVRGFLDTCYRTLAARGY